MSFSASTCLTNTGTGTLGLTLSVYSNPVDQYTPGTFVTTVPKDDITGGNCPYVLELPDGTTSIRLSDPLSGCYVDIPINDNNMCTTCDIDFDTYQSPSIGTLVVGNITGSCEDTITDYLINWYDVTDPLNPVFKFKTGKGNEFLPYLYTHPLTGLNIPLAPSGQYSAVLEKIILNGITFSRDGEPGTVLADLDCLPSLATGDPIIVESLSCTNGTSSLPQYKHEFNYDAGTGGLTPQPLKTSFSLSAGTQFFPWKFKGFGVPDKIKITLSGSSYTEPILLDYWQIGGTLGVDNWNPTSFPKSASTNEYLGRVIDMSNMTINDGDELFIEVTPSTANTQTSWSFFCGCLDTFDCEVCSPTHTATTVSGDTSYIYPIKLSTVTAVTSDTCITQVYFSVSANCVTNDFSNADVLLYAGYKSVDSVSYPNNLIPQSFNNLYLNTSNCISTYNINPANSGTTGCVTLGSGINITYAKSPGLFKITSNNTSVISELYNQALGMQSLRSPFSGDNTNIEYYKYFDFYFMKPASTVQTCGDGTTVGTIRVAQTFGVSTGTTSSDYYIDFTLPTMTYNMSFPGCGNCNTTLSSYVVDEVNNYSTGTSYNYTGTTNMGMYYRNPMYYLWGKQEQTQSNTSGSDYGRIQISTTSFKTYPASGSSNTLIPSFSSDTCPNISNNFDVTYIPSTGYIQYNKWYYYYVVQLFDPTNKNNFRILAYHTTQNGEVVYYLTKIYEWSGGTQTYINNDYFV